MAFIPYTLKNAQTFTRSNSNQQVTLPAGTNVLRETTESETHTFHQFRITRDGAYWYNTITITKQPQQPKIPDKWINEGFVEAVAATQQPVEQEEPEDLGDEVPNCPMCGHHPMVRMSSDKGWRCGSPGNRWQRGRWTVCNGAIWDNSAAPVVPTPAVIATLVVPQEVVYNTPHTNGNGHAPMSNKTSTNDTTKAIISIAKREGISLTTGEQMELEVRRTARIADILSGEIYRVNYYIPDRLKKIVRNPSYIFRRYGYRLDGSHWVFSLKGLEAKPVQEWIKMVEGMHAEIDEEIVGDKVLHAEVTAEVWVDPYPKEERSKMREKVMRRLSQQLIQCHRSLIERINNAAKTLQKAQEKMGPNASLNAQAAAETKQAIALREIIKDACIKFEMALRGAEIYDDSGSLDAMFEAVRDAVATRAIAINGLLAVRGMKQVKVPKSVSQPANAIKVDSKSINPMTMPEVKK